MIVELVSGGLGIAALGWVISVEQRITETKTSFESIHESVQRIEQKLDRMIEAKTPKGKPRK